MSLAGLFEGQRPAADLTDAMTYEQVIAELLRPGFPALTPLAPPQARRMLRAYIDEVARADMPRLVDMRKDPARIRRLISSLARSVASDVTYATLAADMRAVAPSIKAETVADYVGVLERLFVVERQLAWAPALRSRARLRTSPKMHLADPAMAAAALGADQEALAGDPNTTGLLFESAAVHDLMVFAALMDGEVRHYRDSNGHEMDAVICLPDGRWGAVEVKLGGMQTAAGARSLGNAVGQIEGAPQPSFRLVITGTGQTYVMQDGTVTCPLAKLRA